MNTKRRLILGFLLTISTLLTSQIGHSDTTFFFDRRLYKGTFQSYVELYQIARRGNLFQEPLKGPKAIKVTWADFHERLKPFLAKDSKTQGQVGKKITLSDGQVIEPANYYVRDDDSFKYYFEGENGENYLLEDYLAAKKLTKGGNGPWKGKAFGIYQYLLSNKETAKNIGRMTMRGHPKNHWAALDNQMIKDGEINFAPNLKLTFGMTTPEMDEFTHYYDDGERALAKKAVLEDFIKMKGREPSEDGLPHKIIFFEDDPKTIQVVLEVFQKYAQGRFFNIEFGIANLGYESEVEASARPRFYMLNEYGIPRRATEDDIFGDVKKTIGKKPTQCALSLLKVVKK
jgi:hypothetical protein